LPMASRLLEAAFNPLKPCWKLMVFLLVYLAAVLN